MTALETYKQSLAPALETGMLFEFPLAGMDRLGLPLWNVALIGEDGALSDGFGYGPTLEAAQTSAWGETVEWYWTREALKKRMRVTGTYAKLRKRLPVIDPVALNLSAGSDYSHETTPSVWVEAKRWPSGEPVWVPIEFVAPRAADIGPGINPADLLAVPITNGLGAGPTLAHALAHGILELLQRDGNSVQYRALDQGIAVDLDDVQNPDTRALLAHLDAEGIEVIVKLASDDFGMANLYVVGYDRNVEESPQPIMFSACGEAVHPDREVALAKALREYTSARARKAFNHGPLVPVRALSPAGYLEAFRPASMRSEDDRALTEMKAWTTLSSRAFYEMLEHPIYDIITRVKFSDLPTTTVENADALLSLLTERLGAEGLEILYADFTPPGLPATVLKAIVPSLEVETMTYHRIGGRNLRRLLARHSPIAGVGNAPSGALPVRLTEKDADLAGAWLDPAAIDWAMGPLYALYREPGRHVLGFMEESPPAPNNGGVRVKKERLILIRSCSPIIGGGGDAEMTMRICFISRRYFPAISGMSVYAQNLLGALIAMGHDVTMISQYRGDAAGTRVYGGGPPPFVPGVKVIGLEAVGEQEPFANWERDIQTMVDTAVAEHQLKPFNLVHAQYGYPTGLAAMEVSKRLGIPNVVSIQGGDGHWVGPCCETHRDAMRVVLNHAGALLIGSRSFAEEVQENHGTALERFTIVPGAVDTSRFHPRDGWEAGTFINPEMPVLVYHGRVDRRKGALDTLEAVANLVAEGRALKLIVSGIGPDSEAAAARVQELGLSAYTEITGYADYGEAPCVYRRGDIFLSPTYAEGFSNTILEAMASGLPVVSCFAVGVVDCLRDGENGLLVTPGDIPALTQAIARLLDAAPLRRRLAETAYDEAQRLYSWPVIAAKIAGIYEHLRDAMPDTNWVMDTPPDPSCRFRAAPHLL